MCIIIAQVNVAFELRYLSKNMQGVIRPFTEISSRFLKAVQSAMPNYRFVESSLFHIFTRKLSIMETLSNMKLFGRAKLERDRYWRSAILVLIHESMGFTRDSSVGLLQRRGSSSKASSST